MSGHGALWRTDLSLVSYCDDINRFRRRVVPISRQIATIAKRDKNFSKGIQIWHRTPGLGCLSDRDEPIANGSHRPLGSTRIFINQEAPQAAKISDGRVGEPQVWQGGASVSSSVPHVSIHAKTSSPVRCRPVS